jgi:hypothetical protein
MHTVAIANQKVRRRQDNHRAAPVLHAMQEGLGTPVVDLDPQANLTGTMRYRLMINSAEVPHTSRRNWNDVELSPIERSCSSQLLFEN